MTRTDTERLAWLASKAHTGIGLIEDDHGRWAVVAEGEQPVTGVTDDGREVYIMDAPISGLWTFVVDAKDWFESPQAALDHAMDADEGPS